jgi:hypothetical protein
MFFRGFVASNTKIYLETPTGGILNGWVRVRLTQSVSGLISETNLLIGGASGRDFYVLGIFMHFLSNEFLKLVRSILRN